MLTKFITYHMDTCTSTSLLQATNSCFQVSICCIKSNSYLTFKQTLDKDDKKVYQEFGYLLLLSNILVEKQKY